MRVTEALIRQNKRNKQQNAANEEEEPTQCYQERKYEYWALNQQKDVFQSPMNDGINSRESVFDKQAVFRTKEGEK